MSNKKRILYIAPHRKGRSPGQRFRFEQFIPFMKEQGWSITYSYFVSKKDDLFLYTKGNYFRKLLIAIKGICVRIKDWQRCEKYDLIVIYREAHFIGNAFFEKHFAQSGTPVIYDFDDAIWLNDTSNENKNLKWVKNPNKVSKIIKLSTLTIVGNQFLYAYAKQFNDNVKIIPTCINPNYHKPTHYTKPDKSVCIGWTGSSTTLKHFQEILPVLHRIKNKYKDRVNFKVIVDKEYKISKLNLQSTKWSKETEVSELNSIDIGIMPLPNNNWSKGKCGFKGLQYMALEKPTIMSPVGVNTEIIEHNKNGFLAESSEEWFTILCQLIDSEELRLKIGKEGRQTILQKYSVLTQQKVLLQLFEETCGIKR